MIDDVIRAAYELSFNSYGLETAEKYQIDAMISSTKSLQQGAQ